MNIAKIEKVSLDTSVQYLKGIGPKRAEVLKTIGILTIRDFLYYVPRRYLDRTMIKPIARLIDGEIVTVVGKIEFAGIQRGRRPRFLVGISDGTGVLSGIWFNGIYRFNKLFEVGQTVSFSGKVARFGGWQMIHPEFDRIGDESDIRFFNTGAIIPIYPSSEELGKSGLDSRGFRKIFKIIPQELFQEIPEFLPQTISQQHRLMPLGFALKILHHPQSIPETEQAVHRLKFGELFSLEMVQAIRKRDLQTEKKGMRFDIIGNLTKALVAKLPFPLTAAQRRVLREIYKDLRSEQPMNRLLQGDVGSGKTIVALIAMLIVVENGSQAVLMAPTEILAEQHFFTIKNLLNEFGIQPTLITSAKKRSQQEIIHQVKSGEAKIIIGTHALIQEDIEFHKLGLIIIDEQHRFGVLQRAELKKKGYHPDVLVMTATPIPRTLALTLYGDLDISVINEIPKGRKPIQTILRTEKDRKNVYQFIAKEIEIGRQIYIVYPLVEESEKVDLKAASESFEKLRTEIFTHIPVALLHGRMKSEEKEKVMRQFVTGEIKILVSTTVIEVGVDVPNASVMLIEHAERFGLPQLHQLRGRVGRGKHESYCILLPHLNQSEEAKERLNAMVQIADGFKIAEVDLMLRGPGEFFGTRQHGLPELKYVNLITDTAIISEARKAAFQLIDQDPHLRKPEHVNLREKIIKELKQKLPLSYVA